MKQGLDLLISIRKAKFIKSAYQKIDSGLNSMPELEYDDSDMNLAYGFFYPPCSTIGAESAVILNIIKSHC